VKFHEQRTDIEHSPLKGIEDYRKSVEMGEFRLAEVFVDSTPGQGFKVGSVLELDRQLIANPEVEEISGMRIKPRSFLLDEVTRHRDTAQIFIPTNGPVLAAVIPDDGSGGDPNPDFVRIVPVLPGEFVCIETGTWHTLPFAVGSEVDLVNMVGASDHYHDIRDLALFGWAVQFSWPDFQ
jgi:ureidoglycolate hydrolase